MISNREKMISTKAARRGQYLEPMSRQQVMTRKRFERFMGGVPLKTAINAPNGYIGTGEERKKIW